MNISILYPEGIRKEDFRPVPETTWHDLGFDLILPELTRDEHERSRIRNIMMHLSADPGVASYRADVFRDLLAAPDFRRKLQQLLERIRTLEDHMSIRHNIDRSDSLWTLMRRLREIDDYVECVETIGDSLQESELQSEALRRLAATIQSIREESGFEALKKDIRSLRVLTSRVKSVTLGLNLDENYDVSEVGIISLNDRPFKNSGLLSHLTGYLSSREQIHEGTQWEENYTFQQVPEDSDFEHGTFMKTAKVMAGASNPLVALGLANTRNNDNLKNTVGYLEQVMTDMIAASTRELKEVLAKYVTVDIHSITDLIPEFMYYIRWAEYIEKLQAKGYHFCGAAAVADGSLTMRGEGIYNLKLAALSGCDPAEIVPNGLDFSTEHCIYILTGANRGGKTTITQAVGQLFLLAQGGIHVPADRLDFVPADQIFTHFPADEDKTMDYGRLGEECSRFREIYAGSTGRSLILLNESFSTTSFEEGYYIACDAVRAILKKGSRTIYNTHMHKLAREIDALNAAAEVPAKAASLIVKNEGTRRSYRVALEPPEGTSYARDIAEKYGVTFEQLMERQTGR